MSAAGRIAVIAILTFSGFVGGRVAGEFAADAAYPRRHYKGEEEQHRQAEVMMMASEVAGAVATVVIAEFVRLRRRRVSP